MASGPEGMKARQRISFILHHPVPQKYKKRDESDESDEQGLSPVALNKEEIRQDIIERAKADQQREEMFRDSPIVVTSSEIEWKDTSTKVAVLRDYDRQLQIQRKDFEIPPQPR